MSDAYLKLFDNKDVKYASDTTTLDSANSLAAYLNGKEKTVKVNKAYEALAKALIFIVNEGNSTYQTDDFKSALTMATAYTQLGMLVYEDFSNALDKTGWHYKDLSSMSDEELKNFFYGTDGEQINA
jgi:cation transport regulator ChaC